MMIQIHEKADVSSDCQLGPGVVIWSSSLIREGVQIGANSSIGAGVYLGPGVQIGESVKIQNSCLLYEPAIVEDMAFVGPNVVFTNDRHPRSVNIDGSRKGTGDWSPVGVSVGVGASLGASVTCVAPVKIGAWSMVAAGSVVTQDVPDYALVAGVPARQISWVGRAGHKLISHGSDHQCPVTGELYRTVKSAGKTTLEPLSLDANQPPPKVV